LIFSLIFSLILFLIFLSICHYLAYEGEYNEFPIHRYKVSFIGDSITNGLKLSNVKQDCFISQLQKLLTDVFHLQNYGSDEATVVPTSNFSKAKPYSYVNSQMYRSFSLSNPYQVFIMLGTYDSRNKDNLVNFYSHFIDFIYRAQNLPNYPSIVCLIPIHSEINQYGVNDQVLVDDIIPQIRTICWKFQLDILDLHPLLKDDNQLFIDSVLPNQEGHKRIAYRLYEYLKQMHDTSYNPFNESIEKKEFFGYDLLDFDSFIVIQPKWLAVSHPWVWRLGMSTSELNFVNQLTIWLLERGFHIIITNSLSDEIPTMMVNRGCCPNYTFIGDGPNCNYIVNWVCKSLYNVKSIYFENPIFDGTSIQKISSFKNVPTSILYTSQENKQSEFNELFSNNNISFYISNSQSNLEPILRMILNSHKIDHLPRNDTLFI
jgi:lysophospholipase L1-like esterase